MNTEEKKGAFDKFKAFLSDRGVKAEIKEVVNRAEALVTFAKDKKNEDTKIEKFEELKLLDGSMVMIEPEVEAGAAIAAQTLEGEWVPAPAGAYELEDGRIVTVVEDGLIDLVTEAEVDGEVKEVVEEDMSTESPKRVIESIVKEKIFAKQDAFTALEARTEELEKQNKFLLESLETNTAQKVEVENKFTEVVAEFAKIAETLLSEPSAEPVKKNNNPLKKEAKQNMFLSRKNKNNN